MAWRAHRERETPPAEPDFQRLLDCEPSAASTNQRG
jgi:hypothetical protein